MNDTKERGGEGRRGEGGKALYLDIFDLRFDHRHRFIDEPINDQIEDRRYLDTPVALPPSPLSPFPLV
jgi:hypothetical protein